MRRAVALRWSAVLALCVGCMWSLPAARAHVSENYDSVHFHSGMVDFGTVPRRARVRGEGDDRELRDSPMDPVERSGIELTREGDDNRRVAREKVWKRCRAEADRAVQAGDWAGARRAWQTAANRLGMTGTVRDRLEVLDRAAAMGRGAGPAFVRVLRLHLHGLALDDGGKRQEAQAAFQAVAKDPAAGLLREHAMYQLACLAWEWWDYRGAVTQLRALLDAYPQTAKRESVLMMLARCAILPRTAESQQLDVGRWAIAQIEKEHPQTRFARSIRGLRARLLFLEGKIGPATEEYFALGDLESVQIVRASLAREQQGELRVRLLARYLLRLAAARSYGEYDRAIRSVQRSREQMTAAEAHRFSQLLLARPDVASAYLYYRLYHTDNKPGDLRNLAALADAIAARHGSARLAPPVQTRLAEAYYQDRRYSRSVEWATRSLQGARTDRALYVRGASLQKMGRYQPALADYTELLARHPNSPLRRGAREMAAIVLELMGDLAGALDQYFELNYTGDIAFMLDVRMSIPQIEALQRRNKQLGVLCSHEYSRWRKPEPSEPTYTRGTLIRLSLGVRYLRDGRLDEAEKLLRAAPASVFRPRWNYGWAEIIPTRADLGGWMRNLRALSSAIARGKGDEQKAEAIFRYATYIYKGSDLIFYNWVLWRGSRNASFSYWWNRHHATHEDTLAAQDHHYRHEIYARAEAACLEIVRRYPHARVAPQALYRAACCERHLANFSGWWREDCKREDHWTRAVRLMRRMAAIYPRSPLAHAARKYAVVFGQERNQW